MKTKEVGLKPIATSNLDQFEFNYFNSIEPIAHDWDSYPLDTIFLKSPYLSVLEDYPPENFEFRYCLVYKKDKLVGLIYYQIRPVELDKNFQDHHHKTDFSTKFRKFFLSFIRHQLLICGNVLLTGPYGFRFNEEISQDLYLSFLKHARLEIIKQYNFNNKNKIKTVLYKDFEKLDVDSKSLGFNAFQIQPSMVMKIAEHWNSMEDYKADIKSKYKVRYKRAKKKFGDIDIKLLGLDEVRFYQDQMNVLFLSTASKADFSLFDMHPNYFLGIQERLGDQVKTYGLFKGGEMIAFFTLIYDDAVVEAHFLGYDIQKNREHQVYQNMLYSMIEKSIAAEVKELSLSRTALEIKSSIGAKPKDLTLFLKYEGDFINKQMHKFLKTIAPAKEWEERNPFKD